jgi:Domain of unknown function (DUF4386)
MRKRKIMNEDKKLARKIGVLYLVLAVLGAFAHLIARGAVYVPGDAAETTQRIVDNAYLFRLGFVADLVQTTLFLLVGFGFYLLLSRVNKNVAKAMVVFVAVATALILGNMIHHLGALLVATDPSYAASLGVEGSQSLVLLLLDLHHYGYLIAQIFFGLWLLPLGYLAYKSGLFPRALGVMLVIACFTYLLEVLITFLIPGATEAVTIYIVIPSAVAEFWMVFYLLIIGVRTPKQSVAIG